MDILHPTPEEMAAALLDAAEAERWNHWKHEVKQHADDWCDAGDTRQRLTNERFSWILAVYDPLADEIIHCTRPDHGKRYCERWGEQTKTFVSVRWRR